MNLLNLLFGTVLLSVIHSLIPNHWLPLVAVARADQWNAKQLLTKTFVIASLHALSTLIIGLFIADIGFHLSQKQHTIAELLVPVVMIVLGLVYIGINHTHEHLEHVNTQSKKGWSVVFAIGLAMFLSPCLEMESFFLLAGTYNSRSVIALVGLVYFLTTTAGIMLFTYMGWIGFKAIKSHWLIHHEKKVSGIVLIVFGIISFYLAYFNKI